MSLCDVTIEYTEEPHRRFAPAPPPPTFPAYGIGYIEALEIAIVQLQRKCEDPNWLAHSKCILVGAINGYYSGFRKGKPGRMRRVVAPISDWEAIVINPDEDGYVSVDVRSAEDEIVDCEFNLSTDAANVLRAVEKMRLNPTPNSREEFMLLEGFVENFPQAEARFLKSRPLWLAARAQLTLS